MATGFVAAGQELVVQACRRTAGTSRSARVEVLFQSAGDAKQARPPQLVKVATRSRAQRQELANLGLDVTGHGGRGWSGVVLHGKRDEDELRRHGFTWTVLDRNILDVPRPSARMAQSAARDFPSGRKAESGYRLLADYETELKSLAEKNPDIVRLVELPHKTYEGRTVLGVEITTNPGRNDGKPIFMQMGVHHAREWPSAEHALEWAYEMVNGYRSGNARTRALVENLRTTVVPLVNPDGFNWSRNAGQAQGASNGREGPTETANIVAIPAEYQRKNCRYPPPQEGGNCVAVFGTGVVQGGVDPNRNYGTFWGGAGATDDPTDQTYYGPGPFSEPETQNIRDYISARHVTALITNHTFSDLVLRAPGTAAQGPPFDEDVLRALGEAMTNENGYLNLKGYELYDTTGTTEDWSYNSTAGLGYTFEIGCDELDVDVKECVDGHFHPAYAKTLAEWEGTTQYADQHDAGGNPTRDGGGNRAAYYHAAEAAMDPRRHSVIAGGADPGATLRLKKSFDTPTSKTNEDGTPVTFKETLDTTMQVPGSGKFEWHINPSTRPLVAKQRGNPTPGTPSPGKTENGAPGPSAHPCPTYFEAPDTRTPDCWNDHELDIPENGGGTYNEAVTVQAEWNTEGSDWDLEIYEDTNNDGSSADETGAPVASSASGPNHLEATSLGGSTFKPGGHYVVRMVNFAAAEPYELTITFTREEFVAAQRESWTLTCETPDGRVIGTRDVQIERGQRIEFDICVPSQSCEALGAGTPQKDTIDGGLGDDCISGKGESDRLSGGSGNDRVAGDEGVDYISGGPGGDGLAGGAERDFMTGDGGNDTINGDAGSNVVDGGAGDDTIVGGSRSDSLNGGADEDKIDGKGGNDGITGASGKDTLVGGSGNDRIEGGLGSDVIRAGSGRDSIVVIDGQQDTVRCGTGRDTVRADGGDRISRDCENVIERPGSFASKPGKLGKPHDLSGVGNRTSDQSTGGTLGGTAGNDTLDLVFKTGKLVGGGGSDMLSGGSENDEIDGGDGIDILSGAAGDDRLLGGAFRDFMEGGAGRDRLEGQTGSNILNGSIGNDTMTGGASADSMNGGSDEDRISGAGGNDGITGASGNDRLFGGSGADRIEGGLGRDTISGGMGGDNIVAADGARDVIRCGSGGDVVRADAEDRIARDCEVRIVRRGSRFVTVRR